jgi:hypothetical protein
MALLGATSLTGCDSIPSFIAAGTKMIFQNATSPVNWTKDTTVSEGMLRVVNGATLSPGGTSTFSQVFVSNKPISVQAVQNVINLTIGNAPAQVSSLLNGSPVGSVPGTTLQQAQNQSHGHSQVVQASVGNFAGPGTQPNAPQSTFANTFFAGPGGGTHTHGIGNHDHSYTTTAQHNHTISGQHAHTVTSTSDFDIQYVDMIISTKD